MADERKNTLIGNLLDHWQGTPNDLKAEIREFGCGKQLDELFQYMEYEQPVPSGGAGAEDARDAARQAEIDCLEQFLTMASEPVGQQCCGQGRGECCGCPEPVYASPNEVFQAMSDRHAELIAAMSDQNKGKV